MEKQKKEVPIYDLSVTQSNPLVEALYPRTVKKSGREVDIDTKVTTRAHKVSRLIVSLVNPNDDNLRLYKVDIAALKAYLGYKPDFPNGKFYQDLRDIAIRLNTQPIEIRPEPKRVITAFFISSYELNYKTGEVIFEISAQLKPFLLQLKQNFTSFHLANIPRLSSGYSIRLYELLYQYKTIGKRKFEDIEHLQKMIGSNYEKYSHFKARVLEPTKKDIESHTDISFDYEELKTGRKITGLLFRIHNNKQNTDVESDQNLVSALNTEGVGVGQILQKELKKLGIRSEQIEQYIRQGFEIINDPAKRTDAQKRCNNIEQYYQEKIELLRTSKDKKANPAGFLVKALQEDWVNTKSTQKDIEPTKQNKSESLQSNKKDLEKQEYALKKKINQNLQPILEDLFKTEDIMNQIFELVMLEQAETSLLARTIRQHESSRIAYEKNPALKSMMNQKIQATHPDYFTSLGADIAALKSIQKMLNE